MAVLKYKDPVDGLYYPVSYGRAGMNDLTDADTLASVPAVGDSLVWDGTNWVPSGPALQTPPVPTGLDHAARWGDAIPRFADAAARDAAVTAPVPGMQCYLISTTAYYTYRNGGWRALNTASQAYGSLAGAMPAGFTTVKMVTQSGRWGASDEYFGLDPAAGLFPRKAGWYRVTLRAATGTAAALSNMGLMHGIQIDGANYIMQREYGFLSGSQDSWVSTSSLVLGLAAGSVPYMVGYCSGPGFDTMDGTITLEYLDD